MYRESSAQRLHIVSGISWQTQTGVVQLLKARNNKIEQQNTPLSLINYYVLETLSADEEN